jgi:hypothetical protein
MGREWIHPILIKERQCEGKSLTLMDEGRVDLGFVFKKENMSAL